MCLQAQCILFRRYPEVLEPFKYAGYPMLLQAVALPLQEQGEGPAAHFLGPEQAPRLQVCCVADLVHTHDNLLMLCSLVMIITIAGSAYDKMRCAYCSKHNGLLIAIESAVTLLASLVSLSEPAILPVDPPPPPVYSRLLLRSCMLIYLMMCWNSTLVKNCRSATAACHQNNCTFVAKAEVQKLLPVLSA